MTRTSLADFNCSLARTVDLIGDKWTLMILRDAFYGVSTFSAFKERLGITQTVLSARLQLLVDAEILDRNQLRPDAERYRYQLTAKGHDLLPVVLAIVQWGDRWVFGSGNEPIEILSKATHEPLKSIRVEDQTGKPLVSADLKFCPGPGASEETLQAFEKMKQRKQSNKPE